MKTLCTSIVFALCPIVSASNVVAQAEPEYVADSSRVFWFVQLADTHVDALWPAGNDERMAWAVDEGISTVDPEFVVVTGDLTDSTNGLFYSGPYEAEWVKYREYLDAQEFTWEFFYDVPGNHDSYNDADLNMYREYSLWGSENDSVQPHWVVEFDWGKYLFFGLATTANDGRQWPFDNTILTEEELAEFEEVMAADGRDADLIFLFAHHDYAGVDNADQMLAIATDYDVRFYIHGHEHNHRTRYGDDTSIIRYQVASTGKTGSGEQFGIWAVDANAVSVSVWDAMDAWPAIVITAPVDSDLNGVDNPYAPPVPNEWTEAPVRALVFDTATITSVTFRWDDGDEVTMTQQEDPDAQWIGTFDASALTSGTHDLTVTAVGSSTGSYTIAVVVTGDVPIPEPEPEPNPDEATPDMGGGGDADADAGEVPPPDADTPDTGGPTVDVATAPDVDEDAVNIDFGVVADGTGGSADETSGESTGTADEGCGCRTNRSAPAPLFLLAILFMALRSLTWVARLSRDGSSWRPPSTPAD